MARGAGAPSPTISRAADRARAVATLVRLLERGVLKHNVGARLELADIVAGHELVESGRAVGNVVLKVA